MHWGTLTDSYKLWYNINSMRRLFLQYKKPVVQVVDVAARFVVSSTAAAMRQSGEPGLMGLGIVVFVWLLIDLHFRWQVVKG